MEVLCQGSLSLYFCKALWCSPACPQVVRKGLAQAQTKPALEDLDKVLKMFSPGQFLKTLKAWEISLTAEKKIKWNQPPFEGLMSSISPEKRLHFPLWESRVTSPPDHKPLSPPPAIPSWGALFLCKCHPFSHKAPWPCLYVGFHCQVKAAGLWEKGAEERGCAQLAGGPYSHSSQKALDCLQPPGRRPPAEFSPWTMPSAVEPGRALWPFLSLQGGTPFEGSNKGKAVCFHLGSTAPL